MKHLRITRLSTVRRWPGRIYRSVYVRGFAAFVVSWEAIYFGTLWLNGRWDNTSRNLLSGAGLVATFLLLAIFNLFEVRSSKKFMNEGIGYFDSATHRYALGTLAMIHARHGSFDSIPAPDGKRAVRCGCGQYIGLTTHRIAGADPKLVADWEQHVTDQVKTVMDNLEGELNARNAG